MNPRQTKRANNPLETILTGRLSLETFDRNMEIRRADIFDEDRIRQIHFKAFDAHERETVADLASDLLSEPSTPETVNLVAEFENDLFGHIAFSPIRSKEKRNIVGYILAPLAVGPEHQKEGIGTALVEAGLRQLARQDVGIIIVYGDPSFYARFGFETNLAEKFLPPFTLKYPFGWQAIDLRGKESVHHPNAIECVKALNKPEMW